MALKNPNEGGEEKKKKKKHGKVNKRHARLSLDPLTTDMGFGGKATCKNNMANPYTIQ